MSALVRPNPLSSLRATALAPWMRPTLLGGAGVVAFWVAMALFWPAIVPHDPFAVDPLHTFAPPSRAHPLGTDELGRDVLARTLAGARPVLTTAPLATLLSLGAGTLLGLAAGYSGGIADEVLMRTVDAFMSLPPILPAALVLALVGRSEVNVVVVIAILFSPLVARTVRSAVLVERTREYVDAARLRGEGVSFILFREILPNITSPLLVEATTRLGYAVFTAGTLSFLQLGAQPPSPEWGLAVASGRAYVQLAPWVVLSPAGALATLVVGVNLLADGLREVLEP